MLTYLCEHVSVLLDVALLAARGTGLLAHGEHQLAGLAVDVQHAHAHLPRVVSADGWRRADKWLVP